MLSPTFNEATLLQSPAVTRLVTFINPVSFYGFKSMPERDQFDFTFSDGALLTLLHNLFFPDDKIERISFDFSSIARVVLQSAAANGKHVVFVGGSQADVAPVTAVFKHCFPDLCFSVFPGFFDSDEDKDGFIRQLSATCPDIIVCGMGYPRQELFLVRCKELIQEPFIGFTCGGFISQTALRPDYYSEWVKKFGLRWLQRAFMHSHVRQRLLMDYPVFLVKYLWDVINNGKRVY